MARFVLVELALALSACAQRPPAAPRPEPPIAIVIGPAEDASAVAIDDDAAPDADEAPAVALDPAWIEPSAFTTAVPYLQAMTEAREARERVLDALRVLDAGGVTPDLFQLVSSRADAANRWFAAAFHATNAAPAEKVAAALAAAESALEFSKRLDEVGLSHVPAAWRTDPAIALTFEEIADGPSKRWKNEARALVQLCVETAAETKVEDAATARCRSLRGVTGPVALRRGAPRGCRCARGDPLCIENDAWCAR